MSLLAEINWYFGSITPSWWWDWLEMIFGALVFFGAIAQRTETRKFKRAAMTCPLSVATVLAGQLGLAIVAFVGALVFLDGLLPAVAPPRTLIVILMAGFALMQLRALHDALTAT